MAPLIIRRAFFTFFLFLHGFFFFFPLARLFSFPLAPVPVMVRVMINNRVEFVLFPGTLALSPHVFAKFAARHRALFVLYTPVNKRIGFELENS